jgi:hypothetical protein
MKCAVVKRWRHRRGNRLNEGTEPMAIAFGGVQLHDTVVLARKRLHGPKPALAYQIRITASWRR